MFIFLFILVIITLSFFRFNAVHQTPIGIKLKNLTSDAKEKTHQFVSSVLTYIKPDFVDEFDDEKREQNKAKQQAEVDQLNDEINMLQTRYAGLVAHYQAEYARLVKSAGEVGKDVSDDLKVF